MINFFVKHKKVRGVITIFLTIIYLSVYMMIGVFVDGGRVRMAQTVVEDVQQIATENVMAQYNRGLKEYYGLFGISDYGVDEIAEDVKVQLQESIGLQIPKDAIKSFIANMAVGGQSAYENIGIFDGDGKLIDKASDYKEKIVNDIGEYNRKFDPYGLEVVSASASYIDLENTDALRAQMRDEMRYTGYLVLGANFFDAVNKFISVGNSVDAVKDITKTIKNEDKKLQSSQQDYYKSLDDFAKCFQKFVITSYSLSNETNWGKVVLKKNLNDAVTNVANTMFSALKMTINPLKTLFKLVGGVFNRKSLEEVGEEITGVDTTVELNVPTDMGFGEDRGLDKVVEQNKGQVFLECINFDDGEWPPASEYIYADESEDEDEESEPYYHGDEHATDVRACVTNRKTLCTNKLYKMSEGADKCNTLINNCIEMNNIYMTSIGNVISYFKSKCDELHNQGDKESEKIYAQYIETYLEQWNTLSKQNKSLIGIRNSFENPETSNGFVRIIEDMKVELNRVCDTINSEVPDENWSNPSVKLKSYALDYQSEFNNMMENIVASDMQSFQTTANSKEHLTEILALVNAALNFKKQLFKNIEEELSEFNKRTEKPFEDHLVSTNEIFDYEAYIEEQSGFDPEFDKADDFSFDEWNVVEQVEKIMTEAKKIVASLPKNIIDNVHDETYILSHCRDYVHTYRYSRLDDEDKNHENIDNILNSKFIKDQSATQYFTPEQFEKMEVSPAEIEYIIWGSPKFLGKPDTKYDIIMMYTSIFILRLAFNYISALTSANSFRQITEMAACTTIFAPIVEAAAPLIYAIPQAIIDTKNIMWDCQKVNLLHRRFDLDLYEPYRQLANDAKMLVMSTYQEALNNAQNSLDQSVEALKTNTIERATEVQAKGVSRDNVENMLVSIETLNDPSQNDACEETDGNITDAVFFMRDRGINLIFEESEETDEITTANDSSTSDSITEITDKIQMVEDLRPHKIQIGYSDFLLIFLFFRGIFKESQINSLKNVIETNMQQAGQKDFHLRDTYTQVAVETDCNIKYIFMTQAFMKKAFKNAGTENYNKFPINIKTSFAY